MEINNNTITESLNKEEPREIPVGKIVTTIALVTIASLVIAGTILITGHGGGNIAKQGDTGLTLLCISGAFLVSLMKIH